MDKLSLLAVAVAVGLGAPPLDAGSPAWNQGPAALGLARPPQDGTASAPACATEQEPNENWSEATPGPGLGSDPSTPTFCVSGQLGSTQDVDTFATWLGFPFPASEWGTPLHVHGSDLMVVTVYQRVPYGNGWLRIARKAGVGQIELDAGEMYFEHYPNLTPPYLYIGIQGRPQAYSIDNF